MSAIPERSHSIASRFPPHWRLFSVAILGLLAISLWLRLSIPRPIEPVRIAPRASSIAVLPFVNTNPDSADDYLGYGLASELTRRLSGLPPLSVAPLATISGATDVGAVLEGTVRRAGGRLRVSAHLVDVGEGFDLWSETYDRGASELLAVQEEIVRAIAGTLRLPLRADSGSGLPQPTGSSEAYDGYLKGLYLLHRQGPEDGDSAVAALDQAVRIDSGFALAHAALAEARLPPFPESSPPRRAMLMAESAALRALELDSSLAAPHRSLGTIRFGYSRDWASTEAEFQKALALDPRSPPTYQAYSRFLSALGRTEESLQRSQEALALSPGSAQSMAHLGWHYLQARRYDQAREALGRAIELDSTDWHPHHDLALLDLATGNYPGARAHLDRAELLAPLRVELLSASAQLRALTGEPELAGAILRRLSDPSVQKDYVSPYYLACIQTVLGEPSQALASLTRAIKDRSALVPFLGVDPRVDSLRSDPRFARMLHQLRLR